MYIHVIFGSTNMNSEITLYNFKTHPLVPILKEHRLLWLQGFSYLAWSPHFTDRKTEAQRYYVTCAGTRELSNPFGQTDLF